MKVRTRLKEVLEVRRREHEHFARAVAGDAESQLSLAMQLIDDGVVFM